MNLSFQGDTLVANSTFGTLRCQGPAAWVKRFCALKEPDVFLQHRLYRWDVVGSVSGTEQASSCVVAFESRLLIPVSIFKLQTAFPGCEWLLKAWLECVLGDWYSQDELRAYPALAKDAALKKITGREVVSCSTTFGGDEVFHEVRIGERLNLRVQETYAHAEVVAGRVAPLLFHSTQEG